ncbi:response regulator [Gloeomargaritales cyanobacterium VI4D9]|nr:response regulator [Gloeomargaritales cyanobacterium VI4D9]
MMIEDEELRSLYQVASAEHLAKLEAGLLFLENHPQDKGKLEALLRTAHSLKGDSRMLGVKEAETLTHHLEEILSAVNKGSIAFSDPIFKTLFTALDGIKQIAQEAVTGIPSHVSVFHLVAEMMAVLQDQSLPPSPLPASFDSQSHAPFEDDLEALFALTEKPTVETSGEHLDDLLALIQETTPPASPPAPKVSTLEPELQSDSIRIPAAKLDELLQYVGELTMTQQRLSKQLELVNEVTILWEQVNRNLSPLNDTFPVQVGELLAHLHRNLENDTSRLQTISEQLATDVRNLQLLPLSTVFNLFPRIVRDIAKSQGKEVDFTILGGDYLVDRSILEAIKTPLSHLLRNAVDHGLETPGERIEAGKIPQGQLQLKGMVQGNQITIEVTDDGRGLNLEKIGASAVQKGLVTPAELSMMREEEIKQLIFYHGFSTKTETEISEISGRGVGLDVVKDTIEKMQGELKVTSHLGLGCTFRFTLRTNRSLVPILVVKNGDDTYALPSDYLVISLLINRSDIFFWQGQPTILWEGQMVPVRFLADLLPPPHPELTERCTCMVLRINDRLQGLMVTDIIDYLEVPLKPQLLPVPQLLGVTILGDGRICHVLNLPKLMTERVNVNVKPVLPTAKKVVKVLLVEDSLPIRTQLRRILEKAGYEVTTAVDGAEGLQKLQQDRFSAIISDVEMPNLSGIAMTEQIRASQLDIPIVLVTTLAKATDRERGLKAGANAYLTKGDFDQNLLLDTLRRLIS